MKFLINLLLLNKVFLDKLVESMFTGSFSTVKKKRVVF